jgi:hypothetical protein
MFLRVFVAAGLAVALAAPAQAQIEITGNIGWTVSSGISGDAVEAPDGNLYNKIEPVDGASFAFTIGYIARNGGEFGFQWGRQLSELQLRGTATTTVGDMNVDNYHGYFAYNFGEFDSAIRPYVMAGVGATNFGSVKFNAMGQARSTASTTRFSTTWGAGVKMYAGQNRNVGFKAGIRWTPTYITSESAGWWCDPWWGCYVVGNSKYAHQFEVSGGVAIKFGG